MQAGQQSCREGKKKKIDYLYEINFSSLLTALLPGPPLHAPRCDNSMGFFDRVNGGGLISLILTTSSEQIPGLKSFLGL